MSFPNLAQIVQERKETLTPTTLGYNGGYSVEPESTAGDRATGGGGADHAHHRVVEARTTLRRGPEIMSVQ